MKVDSHFHRVLNVSIKSIKTSADNFDFNSICPKYNFRSAYYPMLYAIILKTDWSFIFFMHTIMQKYTP